MRQLYSVWDRKAEAYGPVMSYAHDAVAVRDFQSACAEPSSSLYRYPSDFELHSIAELQDSPVMPVEAHAPRVVITAAAIAALRPAEGKPELVKEA